MKEKEETRTKNTPKSKDRLIRHIKKKRISEITLRQTNYDKENRK